MRRQNVRRAWCPGLVPAIVLFLVAALPERQAEALPLLLAEADGGAADGLLQGRAIRRTPPAAAAMPAPSDVRVERTGRDDLPDVLMRYPGFGVREVDRDIAFWCAHLADTFERDFAAGAFGGGNASESWLTAGYTFTRPSRLAASVVFDVWMCTESGTLSQDVLTLSYNMLTGQRLHLLDIFENPDEALAILAGRAREVLARRVGGGRVDAVIARGTAPEPENYASIALTQEGVRVFFQPYQVTLFGGSQTVDVPLEALMPAGPLLALWGR